MTSIIIKEHPYEEPAFDFIPLKNNNLKIGSGMIGELDEEMEVYDFLNFIKKVMKAKCIRHTKIIKKKIKKIAVCGGSGRFLLEKAINKNADIFISSDFKYHDFFDANDKIIVADIEFLPVYHRLNGIKVLKRIMIKHSNKQSFQNLSIDELEESGASWVEFVEYLKDCGATVVNPRDLY